MVTYITVLAKLVKQLLVHWYQQFVTVQQVRSLVPAVCNNTSGAQVHDSPQTHCGDNQEGALFS